MRGSFVVVFASVLGGLKLQRNWMLLLSGTELLVQWWEMVLVRAGYDV